MGFVIVLEIPWGSLNCVLCVCVCVCVFYEICSIGSIVMDFRTLGLIYIVALQRRRLYLTKIYVFLSSLLAPLTIRMAILVDFLCFWF
jgi:hypothetical protein